MSYNEGHLMNAISSCHLLEMFQIEARTQTIEIGCPVMHIQQCSLMANSTRAQFSLMERKGSASDMSGTQRTKGEGEVGFFSANC